jgi:hypothetical protein
MAIHGLRGKGIAFNMAQIYLIKKKESFHQAGQSEIIATKGIKRYGKSEYCYQNAYLRENI